MLKYATIDEEINEGKRLQIFAPSKLWTRLPILLAILLAIIIKRNLEKFIKIKKWNQSNTVSFVSAQ